MTRETTDLDMSTLTLYASIPGLLVISARHLGF